MTKPLSKEQLIREAWITALRRQGERQCHGGYVEGHRVCALGLLMEIMDSADRNRRDWAEHATGLSFQQNVEITLRNDGKEGFHKHTFSEIADVVEGWFKD